MIRSLGLRSVGPALDLKASLLPRTNVITGDNGLGKTFLLDVAWWAISGRWVHQVATPAEEPSDNPEIRVEFGGFGDEREEGAIQVHWTGSKWSPRAGPKPEVVGL